MRHLKQKPFKVYYNGKDEVRLIVKKDWAKSITIPNTSGPDYRIHEDDRSSRSPIEISYSSPVLNWRDTSAFLSSSEKGIKLGTLRCARKCRNYGDGEVWTDAKGHISLEGTPFIFDTTRTIFEITPASCCKGVNGPHMIFNDEKNRIDLNIRRYYGTQERRTKYFETGTLLVKDEIFITYPSSLQTTKSDNNKLHNKST